MGWLGDIFSGGASGIIDGVGNVVDRFITTSDEKNEFMLEMEKVVNERMQQASDQANIEMRAKSDIIVAELNQGDNYTKRMRPTLGYFGMAVIAFNYCLVPLIAFFMGMPVAPFALPTEFWIAWGGMMATYSIGRTREKQGKTDKVTKMITTDNPLKGLLG